MGLAGGVLDAELVDRGVAARDLDGAGLADGVLAAEDPWDAVSCGDGLPVPDRRSEACGSAGPAPVVGTAPGATAPEVGPEDGRSFRETPRLAGAVAAGAPIALCSTCWRP